MFLIDVFKEILNYKDKFDQFIRELPQMKALQEEKEMLLTSNKAMADYCLSQVGFIIFFHARWLSIIKMGRMRKDFL